MSKRTQLDRLGVKGLLILDRLEAKGFTSVSKGVYRKLVFL